MHSFFWTAPTTIEKRPTFTLSTQAFTVEPRLILFNYLKHEISRGKVANHSKEVADHLFGGRCLLIVLFETSVGP